MRVGTVLGISIKIVSILNIVISILILDIWILSYTSYSNIISSYTGFWYDISTNLFQLFINGLLTYKIVSHKMKSDNSYINGAKSTTEVIMSRITSMIAENARTNTVNIWLNKKYADLMLISNNIDLTTDVKFITQKRN